MSAPWPADFNLIAAYRHQTIRSSHFKVYKLAVFRIIQGPAFRLAHNRTDSDGDPNKTKGREMKWNIARVENPPVGSHLARCIGLIDIGTQHHPGFQGGSPWNSRDVYIAFELCGVQMAGLYKPELKGKIFRVATTVKQSLHPSAKLRKFLVSWRGKDFSNEEIEKFEPKSIVGRGCRLTLVERNSYVNIDGIAPCGPTEKPPKATYPLIVFSLEKEEFDQKVYAQLPESLRNKIAKSPEFKALVGAEPEGEEPDQYAGEDESNNIPF